MSRFASPVARHLAACVTALVGLGAAVAIPHPTAIVAGLTVGAMGLLAMSLTARAAGAE